MSFKVIKRKEVMYNCPKDIAEHHEVNINLSSNVAMLIKAIENQLNEDSDKFTKFEITRSDLSC